MTLYEDLGGFDAILAVCRRWNALCLADPVAAHPFDHGGLHPQHDERLAAYLAEAAGGPALYTGGYGDETGMQRLHAGNGIAEDMEDACISLFARALAEEQIPAGPAERLGTYFREVTLAMREYGDRPPADVPDDLPLHHV